MDDEYQSVRRIQALDAAEYLINIASRGDLDHKAFATTIAAAHRTHQQSVMRLMACVIEGLAGNSYDGRNQATVQFAKEVEPVLDQYVFPYI